MKAQIQKQKEEVSSSSDSDFRGKEAEEWFNDPIWDVLWDDYKECMRKQGSPILFMLENNKE